MESVLDPVDQAPECLISPCVFLHLIQVTAEIPPNVRAAARTRYFYMEVNVSGSHALKSRMLCAGLRRKLHLFLQSYSQWQLRSIFSG